MARAHKPAPITTQFPATCSLPGAGFLDAEILWDDGGVESLTGVGVLSATVTASNDWALVTWTTSGKPNRREPAASWRFRATYLDCQDLQDELPRGTRSIIISMKRCESVVTEEARQADLDVLLLARRRVAVEQAWVEGLEEDEEAQRKRESRRAAGARYREKGKAPCPLSDEELESARAAAGRRT